MSRVIADGLSKRATATTAEAEAGTADKYPDAAGVHAAFNQYGLGVPEYSDGVDADSYGTPGSFITPISGHVNFPPAGNNGRCLITVVGGLNGYIEQVVQQRYAPNRRFVRSGPATDTLSGLPWREIYHQDSILGIVSQSAGVPTGAIIEAGSNANGSYTKFADGTMICANADFALATGATTELTTGALFITGTEIWSFPVSFVDVPTVSILPKNSYASWGCTSPDDINVGSTSASECRFALIRAGSSSTGPFYVSLTAVGRWY